MNINIQDIVNQKIKEMEASGLVAKTLEENIEKAILGAIDSGLKNWKLQKELEDIFVNQVSAVVKQVGFTAYNTFIAEKIKEITEDILKADISEKIQKTFDNILLIKRENINLSEIFSEYRNWVCGYVDTQCKYDRRRFHLKFHKHEKYDWYDIELGEYKPENNYSRNDDLINFTLHRKPLKTNEGYIGNPVINGTRVKDKFKFGNCSEFELLLINLHLNETPIIIDIEDEDDIDNTYDVDI